MKGNESYTVHRQAMIRKSAAFKKLIEKESKSVISQLRILIHLLLTLTLMLTSLKSSNEQIDAANISIIDDFSAEALDGISLEVDLPKGRCS